MENVTSLNQTLPSLLILDVVFGIGITKFVSNAPTSGSSTLMESACPSLINVKLTLRMVPVLNATRAMTSKKDNACSLNPTRPNLLILDVEPGIGTNKSALNAPTNGSSTLRTSVFPSLTNAKPTTQMEPVLNASKDTT